MEIILSELISPGQETWYIYVYSAEQFIVLYNFNKGQIARKDFTTFLVYTTKKEHNISPLWDQYRHHIQNGQSIELMELEIIINETCCNDGDTGACQRGI